MDTRGVIEMLNGWGQDGGGGECGDRMMVSEYAKEVVRIFEQELTGM